MRTFEQAMKELQNLFNKRKEANENIARLDRDYDHFGLTRDFDYEMSKYKDDISYYSGRIKEVLNEQELFPTRHIRHFEHLSEFEFEKSVFIMTKFPSGQDALSKQLQTIIDVVKENIQRFDFHPRIASQRDYHPRLWDNVEQHMFGCQRGVAIVEDKYLKELNPNVAMEWGWMMGMGREVLFIKEESFESGRADWSGLIEYEFKWEDPSPGIEAALEKFLKKEERDSTNS